MSLPARVRSPGGSEPNSRSRLTAPNCSRQTSDRGFFITAYLYREGDIYKKDCKGGDRGPMVWKERAKEKAKAAATGSAG